MTKRRVLVLIAIVLFTILWPGICLIVTGIFLAKDREWTLGWCLCQYPEFVADMWDQQTPFPT